jgi:lipid-A-disaccharide synthase
MSNKRLYIIAGEASGDLHGANLMNALYAQDSELNIRFWGGDRMKEEGGECVKHIKELAFMGFVEVLMNLRTILGNIKLCKKDIEAFNPDALLLIDYPGFNLRIAEWAHENGIKVYYYISPQIWAWKQGRVHKIKKLVDHMYVILPFEKDFYKKFNYEVDFVGHPLLDEIERYRSEQSEVRFKEEMELDHRPIIAVLPGSRDQEIKRKLPIMLESLKDFESHQVVIAGAPNFETEYYSQFIGKNSVRIVCNKTYDLLNIADIAVVTSGTATLETALFGVPLVVCYKGSNISYQIAKRLVKVDYISLVNLIMNDEVVKELIQAECNVKNIREEVDRILHDTEYRAKLESKLNQLEERLGGGASKKVAQSLLKTI